MASIKDVAKAAGVSTATVSRVLSGKPYVRPEVQARVRAAATDLGYRQHLLDLEGRPMRSSTIGLIVSDIRNPFFTAVSRAVEDAAHENGYSIFLGNADENPQREAHYLNLLREQGAAGLIFAPTPATAVQLADVELPCPTVIVDQAVEASQVDVVLIDNVAAALRLTIHLLDNGYRRIGGLFGQASATGRLRQQGMAEALDAAGAPLDDSLIRFVPPHIETGQEAARALLSQPERPDALLTSNNLLMAGALLAIRERRLSIPDDIALVGFDDTVWSRLVQPSITLIAQPTEDIGRTAVELLLQRIANPKRPSRQVMLQGQLLVRGSSSRTNK